MVHAFNHSQAHGKQQSQRDCRWVGRAHAQLWRALHLSGGATLPRVAGKRIMDANFEDLLKTKGLAAATDVVLSGHSAGGLATYLHADYVRTLLPASVQNYRAVPDAGFVSIFACAPMTCLC